MKNIEINDKLNEIWNIKPEESSCILLKPTVDSCVEIATFARKIGHPPTPKINADNYHVTLRYWRNHQHLAYDIIEALETHKREILSPIDLQLRKFDVFGNSLVMRFSSPIIDGMFECVESIISSYGVPPSDFLTFKPHLTIAEGVEKVPSAPPNFSIKINTIQYTTKNKVLWEFTYV